MFDRDPGHLLTPPISVCGGTAAKQAAAGRNLSVIPKTGRPLPYIRPLRQMAMPNHMAIRKDRA